jgi:hypothetical protein
MIEMTYEIWCQRSKALLAEADEYNKWRDRARMRLLTDIAPRIGKLSTRMYMGCGFHYGMEQTLGRLINDLALPTQWCANWCAKIPEQQIKMIITQVSVGMLIEQVRKAEQSVKNAN